MTSDVLEVNPKQLVTKEYLDTKFQQALAPVKTELAILKWLVGFNLALTLAMLWKIFS
jgi:hypothetical protein